jgi:hypothetical protein
MKKKRSATLGMWETGTMKMSVLGGNGLVKIIEGAIGASSKLTSGNLPGSSFSDSNLVLLYSDVDFASFDEKNHVHLS